MRLLLVAAVADQNHVVTALLTIPAAGDNVLSGNVLGSEEVSAIQATSFLLMHAVYSPRGTESDTGSHESLFPESEKYECWESIG
jgi:hypothetical protein